MKKLLFITFLSFTSASFAQYCISGGPTSTGDSDLGNITLSGQTNSINILASCPGTLGVEDLTSSQSADLVANNNYTAIVEFNTCAGGTGFNGAGEVWIDFNFDEIFDANESVGTWSGAPPSGPQNFTFTVPRYVCNGPTRIRFMQMEGGTLPLNPCEASMIWGAVIDAEVVLSGGDCEIAGCMDPDASNYNPNATIDDGSCVFGSPQDCIGAIPLCVGAVYESPNGVAYEGIGDVTNEFSTDNTCFGTGSGMPAGEPEVNSVWYTFTVPSAGDLNFTITPNDASIDYDWAVFDITGPDHSCETLHEDGAVSCNWSGSPGPTGPNGGGGTQEEDPFPVIEGNTYALVVTDFAASDVGFSIDFSESTANIFATDMNTVDQEICYGDSADLNALYLGPTFGQQEYSWEPTDMVVDSIGQKTTSVGIFQDSIVFFVTLKSGQCDFKDSVIVIAYNAHSEFDIEFDSILSPVVVDFTNLSDSNTIAYFWDFGDSTIYDERDPLAKEYTIPKKYTVMLATENELGCVDTSYRTFNVPEFEVPNIITPNGDGINDKLIITGLKDQMNLSVYNRWGKLVDEVYGYQNDWSGGELNDGLYYYTVGKQEGSEILQFKGWLLISR